MRWFHQVLRRIQSRTIRNSARSRTIRNGTRLCLEGLENRLAPAVVTTQAGLIAAINAANHSGGTNFIALHANISLFQSAPFSGPDGTTGLPPITSGDNLIILGSGHTLARSFVAGDANFRLFDVEPGASLSLYNMTLAGGLETGSVATGGAIDVHGSAFLGLHSVTISSSAVADTGGGSTGVVLLGGAIYNEGTATLVNSTIVADSARFALNNALDQGDMQGNSNGAAGSTGNNTGNGLTGNILVAGGGIYNTGKLSIQGGGIYDNLASATVTNGSLTPGDVAGNGNFDGNNDASNNNGNGNGNGVVGNVTVQGGGIYNVEVLSLNSVAISGNVAMCNVTNGSDNGNNNSDSETGDNNGNNNGNGVTGNVEVAGGGIYNNGQLTTVAVNLAGNFALCSVTNGNNNGGGDAVGTNSSDGSENGDGVVGNILVSGGGITNDSAGTATVSGGSTLTSNSAACNISNGNYNGSGDGDNNIGNNEGRNNGNGVVGSVEVAGGGLDNESGGRVTMIATVSSNSATSSVYNGSFNGDNDGNANGANDGNGDGLASDLTVHGGGIRNAGTLSVFSSTLSGDSVTSVIHNANFNGDNCGDGDGESEEGRANGNGVSGSVLLAGGAIANSSSLGVVVSRMTYNSVNSTVSNGTDNGNSNGQDDAGFDNCGNNCGNAIGEGPGGALDLEIVGGAIANSGNATLFFATITNNDVFSSIRNGNGNGGADGVNTTSGDSGVGDGNGVHGDLEAVGGGTANFGSMSRFLCNISGNSVSSNTTSGGGSTGLNGLLVDGSVTVGGSDTFG
jgi:hypothetical protein